MNYRQLLHTPQWREFRQHVIDTKGYRCDNCGCDTDKPQVHHKGYVWGRMPWQYEVDEVRVLCDKCHGIIHERRDEFRLWFQSLTWKTRQLLLRVLQSYTDTHDRTSFSAWDAYRYMRDRRYEVEAENERLEQEDEKSKLQRNVDNGLLALTDSQLDPLLDGLDHLAELPEVDTAEILRGLLKHMENHEHQGEQSPPQYPEGRADAPSGSSEA